MPSVWSAVNLSVRPDTQESDDVAIPVERHLMRVVRRDIHHMDLWPVTTERVVTKSPWERRAHKVLQHAIDGVTQLRIQRLVVAAKALSDLYRPFRQEVNPSAS